MLKQKRTLRKAPSQRHFPLSYQQERIWLMLQRYPESAAMWNMIFQIKMEENIDAEIAEKSFGKLIKRHRSLQTKFRVIDSRVVQVVEDYRKHNLQVIDLDGLNEADQEKHIEAIINRQRALIFDLENAPLCRMILIRSTAHESVLLCIIHHIITDAYANRIFEKDYVQIYNALKNKTGITLPPLKRQYPDYVHWQHSYWSGNISDSQKYWLDNFSGGVAAMNLPYRRLAGKRKSLEGDAKYLHLDVGTTARIKAFCSSNNIPEFSYFLTAYAILLQKYSGQTDLVISSPFRGRNEFQELNDIVGLFVNIVPFRIDVNGEQSIRQLLKSNQRQLLLSYKYQSYPLQFLMEKTNAIADQSRNPLFDVSINYLVEDQRSYDDLRIEEGPERSAKYCQHDLDLSIRSLQQEISIQFTYKVQLFTGAMVGQLTRHLENILYAILEDPDQKIMNVNYLGKEERTQLLHTFNNTAEAYPRESSLVELFEQQVNISGPAIALLHNDISITYDQLNERANQIAAYLLKRGLKRDAVVGIWVDRSVEMIAGIIGILKAGGVCLPIDVVQPPERVGHMLLQSNARHLVTEQSRSGLIKADIDVIEVYDRKIQRESKENIAQDFPHEVAYIIYTSGSTGVPNGVMVSHRSVINYIFSQTRTYAINKDDRIFQFSSIGFDPSIEQIWLSLLNGAILVLADREVLLDNERLNNYISAHSITHFHATPSYLNNITFHKPNTIKRIISGGEPCTADLARRLQQDYKFYNKYGPTETTISSTIGLVENREAEGGSISIGKPLSNTCVYVLGKYLELLPVGVAGELFIGGDGVSQGYINNPELTSQKFIENPFLPGTKMYRTGDLVKWLPDGSLEFLGRADNQVKIRGFRIELEEVENRLAELEGVEEVVVVVRGDHLDRYLLTYYVAEKEISAAEFKTHLSEWFAGYMIPAEYCRISMMPQSPSGKIDRRALAEMHIERSFEYVAPADGTECQLVEIWSEILKLDKQKISAHVSFFEIGGHSLNATRLAHRIFEVFGVEMPLADIFNSSSIQEMSVGIKSGKQHKSGVERHVILLKGAATDKHLFMIHDGSGDIQAYVEFSSMIRGFSCHGIRAKRVAALAPEDLRMEDVAAEYLEYLLKVQPRGPYWLVGWSLGGMICYEVARQLEARGEMVEKLIMLDSYLRFSYQEPAIHQQLFSLQEEKEYVNHHFKIGNEQLQPINSIPALWQYSVTLFSKWEEEGMNVRGLVPEHLHTMIPQFDTLGIAEVISHMNTVRSFQYMSGNYRPTGLLQAQLVYFKAATSRFDTAFLSNCFIHKVICHKLKGDHVSILRQPLLPVLVKKIEALL
ncbi:amino acid adenylation domain-containing protein [Chitinophaga sp. GbtcB8]|uniref:non-ribosomal peptide synthetase n=1 Tax=Chitinophaga sp. GbtcB8 TaxID=2824753 RepID=UPI001C30E064|nr:non-ribosomal peptide synthetase [Chitinophaga sp. GbtcB8]